MPRIYTASQSNPELIAIEGMWWLPDTPEKRIFGILNFNADKGAILTLKNLLVSDLVDTGEQIIHGESDGIKFTLFYSIQGKSEISFGINSNSIKQEWNSNLVFRGIHSLNPEDTKFESIVFETHLLDQWINHPKFNRQMSGGEIAVSLNIPQAFTFQIDNFTKGEIHFSRREKSSNLNLEIYVYPYIEIKRDTGLGVLEFQRNILRPLLYCVSLCTTGTDYVYSTTGFFKEELDDTVREVQIFSPFLMSSKDPQVINVYKHWIKFSQDINYSTEMLRKWFENYREKQEIFKEYFAIRYAENSYLEDDFFRVFKVIESWFNSEIGNFKGDDFAEFDELLERVKYQVSEEDFGEIQSKFINNLSSRESLRILIGRQVPQIQEALSGWKDFLKLCLNTRNKYAHILSRRGNEVFTPNQQHVARYILDLMFTSELMRMLELSESEYNKALQLNDSWNYMKQHLSTIQPD